MEHPIVWMEKMWALMKGMWGNSMVYLRLYDLEMSLSGLVSWRGNMWEMKKGLWKKMLEYLMELEWE